MGMGWFKITPETLTDNFRFSSPLGDGLVLDLLAFTPVKMRFSSPLGDGLVLLDGKATTLKVIIFVPAWGWVGSRRKNY